MTLIERRNERGLHYVFAVRHVEEGEMPEAAAAREVGEETGMMVRVERLVMAVPSSGPVYEREHTYLCVPLGGEAAPGA